MRISKNVLILWLSIFAFVLVVGAYVVNFHGGSISMNTSDWNNFGSYINGLMAPLLMFMNILVLMNINNEISKIGKMNSVHRNKLLHYNNTMDKDFKIQVNPDATAEDNLSAIQSQLATIQELFDEFRESDEHCMTDLDELAKKARICKRTINKMHDVPYYENPFINRMWELHNIKANNTMLSIYMHLFQLKVNVFRLLNETDPDNKDFIEKLAKAMKELEDFHKKSMYVD